LRIRGVAAIGVGRAAFAARACARRIARVTLGGTDFEEVDFEDLVVRTEGVDMTETSLW
jgi:hypothetical protein